MLEGAVRALVLCPNQEKKGWERPHVVKNGQNDLLWWALVRFKGLFDIVGPLLMAGGSPSYMRLTHLTHPEQLKSPARIETRPFGWRFWSDWVITETHRVLFCCGSGDLELDKFESSWKLFFSFMQHSSSNAMPTFIHHGVGSRIETLIEISLHSFHFVL